MMPAEMAYQVNPAVSWMASFCMRGFAVFFDRLDADARFHRSFLVGLAFGNEREHLRFARNQAGWFLRSRHGLWSRKGQDRL